MQQGIKKDPVLVIQLRATFLKVFMDCVILVHCGCLNSLLFVYNNSNYYHYYREIVRLKSLEKL